MKAMEGVILMLKQTLLALLLSVSMVLTVPAAFSSGPPVENEEVTLRDRVAGVWQRTTENTANLRDGLFNKDERLARAQAQIDTQKEIIAQLQHEIDNLRIRTDVEHLQMVQSAERVAQYLRSLQAE